MKRMYVDAAAKVFRVWDELNATEEDGEDMRAWTADQAAEKYAANDSDGLLDGCYSQSNGRELHNITRDGHQISVRCPDDTLTRYRVGIAEFRPVWCVVEIEDDTTLARLGHDEDSAERFSE